MSIPAYRPTLRLEPQGSTLLLPSDREALRLIAAHVFGATVMMAVASAVTWEHAASFASPERMALLILSASAYGFAAFATARMANMPRSAPLATILVTTSVTFALAFAAGDMLRMPAARTFLPWGWLLANVCQAAAYGMLPRSYPRFAVLPGKLHERLRKVPGAAWMTVEDAIQDETAVDALVVEPSAASTAPWKSLVAEWRENGIKVIDGRDVYETLTGRVIVDAGDPLGHQLSGGAQLYGPLRRMVELAILLAILPLLVPVLLVVALLVRFDSPGPIFFWQERMGYLGRPFRMCKFRTMRTDSELAGPKFAKIGDARVTRIGKFLRKSRLDELPQLWNVVRGEMSVIGPRPEQTAFARKFERELPAYQCRHWVKPGITGWAQVNQGYAASADETKVKLEYDLYYVKHYSPAVDVSVILKTIATMATGFGAR